MSKKTEEILVVPTDKFPDGWLDRGVSDIYEEELEELLQQAEYHTRYLMEGNPNYKQIIPYILVKDTLEPHGKLLVYERSASGGENRLHNKYSIGVGGHLDQNMEDTFESNVECFWNGAARELKEELGISADTTNFDLLATVYDDSNDVGKVHFGIVLGYTLKEGETITSGETDILVNRKFVPGEDLDEYFDSMENWSQAILRSVRS